MRWFRRVAGRWKNRLLSGLLLVVALGGWLYAGDWYEAAIIGQERKRVRASVQGVVSGLEGSIKHRCDMLEGFRKFTRRQIEEKGGINWEDFRRRARACCQSVNGIRYISIAPRGVQEHVYPLEGNRELIGQDLLEHPHGPARKDARTAMQQERIVFTGPYELENGGPCFVGRLGVHYEGNGWGIVNMVFDPTPIIEDAGVSALEEYLQISICAGDQNVFYGGRSMFQENPVEANIAFPGGAWTLAVIPRTGWWQSVSGGYYVTLYSALGGDPSSRCAFPRLFDPIRLVDGSGGRPHRAAHRGERAIGGKE